MQITPKGATPIPPPILMALAPQYIHFRDKGQAGSHKRCASLLGVSRRRGSYVISSNLCPWLMFCLDRSSYYRRASLVISHEDPGLMSTEDGWSGALALDMALLFHATVMILGCCLFVLGETHSPLCTLSLVSLGQKSREEFII